MFPMKPPELLVGGEYRAAAEEAYAATAELRRGGVTGFVLVKCTIAKDGTVEDARAIMPPKSAQDQVQVIAVDASTGQELRPPPPHTLHPELCKAAEMAVRKYRFRPATLFGIPIRYRRMRLGFAFDIDG